MPWLGFLVPLALRLVAKIGLPAVKARWPKLAPLIDEILGLMGGPAAPGAPAPAPSTHLLAAADHYNTRCGNEFCKD